MAGIMTHTKIDHNLCGNPLEISDGTSRVSLTTLDKMAVDSHGLVHGGFIFGLADYAAMLAVNDPNVVLASANVKFLKPVKVGQDIVAKAKVTDQKGKKYFVSVSVENTTKEIFQGEFICFVLEKHVLT
jgi:uncharacterized protein (TIGR00369 family)